MNIIKTTKVYQNKVWIPAEIRERLGITDGDKIIWKQNDFGEIVIEKNKKKRKRKRFRVQNAKLD